MGDASHRELRVVNLTKWFGNLHVLDNISFNVKSDEVCVMVGPSGCGKSTTLNIISRLIPATSGKVFLGNEETDPRIHKISYIFQEETCFPYLNVQENIEFGLKIRGVPKAERKQRADKLIKLLGLEEYRFAYPKNLSRTLKQLVILARAFIIEPDILLMDEPYGNFDPIMRRYLEDLIVKLRAQFQCPLLFVTHNIEEACYLGDRVLVLSQKPARIKEEIRIDIPRPRNTNDSRFIKVVERIIELIRWW